jgi:hypothetical protein
MAKKEIFHNAHNISKEDSLLYKVVYHCISILCLCVLPESQSTGTGKQENLVCTIWDVQTIFDLCTPKQLSQVSIPNVNKICTKHNYDLLSGIMLFNREVQYLM